MGNLHLVTGYAGKSHITSADHGAFHAALFGSGDYVLSGHGDQFSAYISGTNHVRVKSGHLLMQGRHAYSRTFTELLLTSGTVGLQRYDLIVARYTVNSTTGAEDCSLVVVTGTPSSSPSDPAVGAKNILNDVFADGDAHDFPLYRVVWNGTNMTKLVPLFDILHTPDYYLNQNQQILDDVNDLAKSMPTFQFGTASIRYRSDKESTVTVNFPSAFAKKPLVLTNQVFNDQPIIVKDEDVTTTGFTARVSEVASGGASGETATYRDFSWVAIQRI